MADAPRRMGILMDPLETVVPYKDTTLALAQAAQDFGWSVEYFTQMDIWLSDGGVKIRSAPLRVNLAENNWFEGGEFSDRDAIEFDCLMMRKDPPFDMNFVYSTYLLEMAERDGVMVVNSPRSLRDCNEKMFATQFPQCCPDLVISARSDVLRDFHGRFGDIILKPLDGMGGASIFRVKPNDSNLSVIIETLTQHQTQSLMAQRFIPEIAQGDKRILLIDGNPVPFALARIPAAGETRGNLAAGGRGEALPLTARDYWICEQVAPTLREKGLLFVGIDVIGDYLTEINVTSPTCIRELDKQCNLNIAGQLMDCIDEKLNA